MPKFLGSVNAPYGPLPPIPGSPGQLYYDTNDLMLYWYNGSSWLSVHGGTAGGVLSGTYPNPSFAVDMATQAELDAARVPTVLSATPPGSPVDGQLWAMAPKTGSVWVFRYNTGSASAYKWEFVGGPPLHAEVAASQNMAANASYIALATAGPSVTLPRAGDYLVSFGAGITGNADASHVWMSFDIGATGAVDANGIDHYTGATVSGGFSPFIPMTTQRRKNGLTAVTLTCKYKSPSTGAYFMNRFLSVVPIRVS